MVYYNHFDCMCEGRSCALWLHLLYSGTFVLIVHVGFRVYFVMSFVLPIFLNKLRLPDLQRLYVSLFYPPQW